MKCMKVLVHQQPYKEILRCFGLEKLFSLRRSSSSWFLLGLICLWIATLEIVLPNHTWNMIISSKPCFVIIKIKINQTLVSHFPFHFLFSTSSLVHHCVHMGVFRSTSYSLPHPLFTTMSILFPFPLLLYNDLEHYLMATSLPMVAT